LLAGIDQPSTYGSRLTFDHVRRDLDSVSIRCALRGKMRATRESAGGERTTCAREDLILFMHGTQISRVRASHTSMQHIYKASHQADLTGNKKEDAMTQKPRADYADTADKDGIVSGSANDNSAETNAANEEANPTEPVELDIADPHFMANAHEIYADLRTKGPVSRVRFANVGAEEASGDGVEERRGFIGRRETYFVTHYDEVIKTLLDDRFAVDPRSTMSPEQVEEMESKTPEEFRLFSRSIISLDPPDHTRLRKLVQPSFTGRGIEALRGNIQQIVDDLLDQAERDAAERGEVTPDRRMDLIEAFAYPFPVTVISDMLGIPREDRETIRRWTENKI
jgi:hypothetical protein